MDKPDFIEWVISEMQRTKVRRSELARVGGLDTGYVTHVLKKESKPGHAFCQAVASVLNIPEEDVLWRAGLIKKKPAIADQPGMAEVIEAANQLSQEQRQYLVMFARLIKSGVIVVHIGNTPNGNSTPPGRKLKANLEVEATGD